MKTIFTLSFCFFVSIIFTQNETELLPDGIIFPRMTSSDRDMLVPIQGHCIYNTNLGAVECFDGVHWNSTQESTIENDFPEMFLTLSGHPRKYDLLGNYTSPVANNAYTIEYYNNKIYVQENISGTIKIFDFDGNLLETIVPNTTAAIVLNMIPVDEERIALLDNNQDSVYFIDHLGNQIQAVEIFNPDPILQNVEVIKVDNYLLISENGNKQIVYVNIDDYSFGIFKDLSSIPDTWLGDLYYANNLFYVNTPTRIYSFTLSGDPQLVVTLANNNIVGFAIKGNTAYVINNGSDAIHEIDLISKTQSIFVSGLPSNPNDIEIR